jgi:hypothetical protein
MLAEPNKTQTRIGLVRFQGSKFHWKPYENRGLLFL